MAHSSMIPVIDQWFRHRVERGDAPGLAAAIVEGGEVSLSTAHGSADLASATDFTTSTTVPIASLTKGFTAALCLMLEEKGRLSLSDPVDRYLNGILGDGRITLRHLLTHTSGVRMMGDLLATADAALVQRDVDGLVLRDPDTRINYSNYGYHLLGKVLEVVSGQSLAEAMRTQLFDPLGMENTGADRDFDATGYLHRDRRGARSVARNPLGYGLSGAGDLVSSVDDMTRWLEAWTTDSLLSPHLKGEMLRTQWLQSDTEERQGLFWRLFSVDGRNVGLHGGHLSGFHHGMFLDPEAGRAGVILTNSTDSDGETWADALLRAPFGFDARDAENGLSRYCGVYESDWGRFALAAVSPNEIVSVDLESWTPFGDLEVLRLLDSGELVFVPTSMYSAMGERVAFAPDSSADEGRLWFGPDEVRSVGSI